MLQRKSDMAPLVLPTALTDRLTEPLSHPLAAIVAGAASVGLVDTGAVGVIARVAVRLLQLLLSF